VKKSVSPNPAIATLWVTWPVVAIPYFDRLMIPDQALAIDPRWSPRIDRPMPVG
jgi:hypothetical protein